MGVVVVVRGGGEEEERGNGERKKKKAEVEVEKKNERLAWQFKAACDLFSLSLVAYRNSPLLRSISIRCD